MYFKYNDTRNKAYFTSNREGSFYEKYETCCNDIYYVNLPENSDSVLTETQPKDSVFIAKSRLQTLVPLTLYFNNDEPDSKTLNTSTTKTYTETVNSYLALKSNYLKAYAKGLNEEQKEELRNFDSKELEIFNKYSDEEKNNFFKLDEAERITFFQENSAKRKKMLKEVK